jgi:hypothetical protein
MNKNMSNKPNFSKSQIAVTLIMTMINNKKEHSMNHQKQSQTNPIQSQSNPIYIVLIRVHSWLNSKQTQMPLGMAYAIKPILKDTPAQGRWADFGQRDSGLSLATVLSIVNRGLDKSRQRREKSGRRELIRRTSLLCVTAFAVNGFALLRLKRNFTFLSAFCTGCFEHLAWSKIPPWATFSKIFHDFSPNRDNKKMFGTLIQNNNYNRIMSQYQEIFCEIMRIF